MTESPYRGSEDKPPKPPPPTHCIICRFVGGISEPKLESRHRHNPEDWYCWAPTGEIDPLTGESKRYKKKCRARFHVFQSDTCPDYQAKSVVVVKKKKEPAVVAKKEKLYDGSTLALCGWVSAIIGVLIGILIS